jgi:hypothetical protein
MLDAIHEVTTHGKILNTGNPWEGSETVYDNLRSKLGFWKAIGANKSVLSWLAYGVHLPFLHEPKHIYFENHKMTREHEDFTENEIRKHYKDGSFYEAPPQSVRVCEPILVLDQKKMRRADDKRYTNAHLPKARFKMQSLQKDAPNIIEPGHVLITRDLEKAYYKVPLCKDSRPYLAISFRNVAYFSRVMLFGMAHAPFFFTKICRPLVRFLQAIKIPALNYIDDWLTSQHPNMLAVIKQVFEMLFMMLGWVFAPKDQEGTRVQFLGFVVDALQRTFEVTPERILSTSTRLLTIQRTAHMGHPVTINEITSILGSVVSMTLAIPAVRVWTRDLYRQTQSNEPSTHLTTQSLKELDMLIFLLKFANSAPFIDARHEREMFVDSGEIGWGAHLENIHCQGFFPAHLIGTSSTRRELAGLLRALYDNKMVERIKGKVVRLNMDAMCAVRNLANGGGPVEDLVHIVKKLWLRCHELKVTLCPVWLNREASMMRVADALSKQGTKWLVRNQYIQLIKRRHNVPVFLPDLARAGPAVLQAITRREHIAILLPRWEAQSWWTAAAKESVMYTITDIQTVLLPNYRGYPMWEFVLAIFG